MWSHDTPSHLPSTPGPGQCRPHVPDHLDCSGEDRAQDRVDGSCMHTPGQHFLGSGWRARFLHNHSIQHLHWEWGDINGDWGHSLLHTTTVSAPITTAQSPPSPSRAATSAALPRAVSSTYLQEMKTHTALSLDTTHHLQG